MFSKKGKRKIVVDNETYYWCVTTTYLGIEPITLQVFSSTEHLFTSYFDYENKKWVSNPSGGHTLELGKAPEITPSIVRRKIENHLGIVD